MTSSISRRTSSRRAHCRRMEGKTAWKLNDQSRKYDYKLIRTRLSNLKTVSENESVSSMMFLLRAGTRHAHR